MQQDDAGNILSPWRGGSDYYCEDLPTEPCPEIGTILVTGASGYIGGRVVTQLVQRGYKVRVMIRGNAQQYRPRAPNVEVVEGDALDFASLVPALDGIAVAYYLIHSMILGLKQFETADQEAARNFRVAAEAAGVRRIIYLGGLGHGERRLSRHLESRNKVARELRSGSIPATTLHASIIIGSGSASFEIIKHLVHKLLIIPIPTWGMNLGQPIGIRDVVKYLVGVLEKPETTGNTYDIGGPESLTYAEMMKSLAVILNKRRWFFSIPMGGTRLFGYMMSLLTPVPAPITLCLTDGLKNNTVCRSGAIKQILPFEPLAYKEAVVRALSREEQDSVATRWSDAYPPAHELSVKLHELRRPPRYRAQFTLRTERPAPTLFTALTRIGGRKGWFTGNWMWRLRGAFDRMIFGVGSARGRRSDRELHVHDVIDFWRVEDLQPDRRLLLRAEMKMPGRAWLEFAITPEQEATLLSITAHYATHSFWGRLYWHVFQPFHWYIFARLLKQIEARSF